MNKMFFTYVILLAAFAVYLAYLQYTWFSVFVLSLSFLGYALLLGTNMKRNKDV